MRVSPWRDPLSFSQGSSCRPLVRLELAIVFSADPGRRPAQGLQLRWDTGRWGEIRKQAWLDCISKSELPFPGLAVRSCKFHVRPYKPRFPSNNHVLDGALCCVLIMYTSQAPMGAYSVHGSERVAHHVNTVRWGEHTRRSDF